MGLSSASSIGSAARKRGGKVAGYHWFFADEAPQSADTLPAPPRNAARTATCVETGETFPSLKSAAQSVGLKGGTSIRIAAETGVTAGGFHWTVTGITPPPQLTESRARTARHVVCVETGEVFDNLQAAAESAGLKAASSINRAINQQRPAAGKHWRWADESESE